jgi:hypothetical protein
MIIRRFQYLFLFQVPTHEQEWEKVMQGFYTLWNFPNCCGATDGKHIVICCPSKSGSEFCNYKEHYSVILVAIVDTNYKFMYIDVGTNVRVNDSSFF